MQGVEILVWLTGSLMLVLLGVSLFVLLGRTAGTRRLGGGSALRVLTATAAWVLLLIGAFSLSLFTGAGILLWLLALVLLAMAATQVRIRRSDMLLWSLSSASRHGIPLTTSTSALTMHDPPMVGSVIQDFGQALSAGAPLSGALREAGQIKSDESHMLVSIGDHFGLPADALREAVKLHTIQAPLRNILVARLFYLFFVGSVMLNIWTFMAWKIVPAFQKILDDFGVEFPPVTILLIAFSHWMINYGFILGIPLSIVTATALCLLLQYMGWVFFRIPLLERYGYPLQRAVILQCLAIVTRHGKSLTEAINVLAEIHPRRYVEDRLQRTAAAVEGGAAWHQAMRRFGLLKHSEAAVLKAAARVGNLSWAMREMADDAVRRYHNRLQAIVQALALAVLLLLGVLVFWIVVGMFLPLIQLIQSLS